MNSIVLDEFFYEITLIALPFIIHYFYSHYFTCRVESKLYLAAIYTIYYIFVTLLHFSSLPGIWMLALNAGSIILLSFLYHGQAKWRIGAGLFIVSLILLTDVAIGVIQNSGGYILSLFLSKMMMFLLVRMTLHFTRAFGKGDLSPWYWVGLFCFPFIGILGITGLTSNLTYHGSPVLYSIFSSGMLAIQFLMILLCDRVLTIQSAQHKNSLLEQQNIYYINQYLLTKERQEEVFAFQHDFKNILLGLRSQLQSGEKRAGLSEVEKLLERIEDTPGCCNTGTILIDSIVNYKQQVAEKLGIAFEPDIRIPPHLDLETNTLSIILGNTLDNAIEAAKQQGVTKPYIKFQLHYLNETLFIRIQNPYQHQIRQNQFGELTTTKKDKQLHGLGLKSVKKMVDESGGIWNISYENEIFQVEICLFNVGISSASQDHYEDNRVTMK
ncbi:GHKL domain-containing protein [Paenibacillus sp. NPDC058177]|uniref:GHKL domain-containing protein n=1 Tax=Paenibacillus sp. NPDC058177 TaxID=3346369 RepID=UPI0036DE9B04